MGYRVERWAPLEELPAAPTGKRNVHQQKKRARQTRERRILSPKHHLSNRDRTHTTTHPPFLTGVKNGVSRRRSKNLKSTARNTQEQKLALGAT